jgi:hypothetical protein
MSMTTSLRRLPVRALGVSRNAAKVNDEGRAPLVDAARIVRRSNGSNARPRNGRPVGAPCS